jgi:hypothetical protein
MRKYCRRAECQGGDGSVKNYSMPESQISFLIPISVRYDSDPENARHSEGTAENVHFPVLE